MGCMDVDCKRNNHSGCAHLFDLYRHDARLGLGRRRGRRPAHDQRALRQGVRAPQGARGAAAACAAFPPAPPASPLTCAPVKDKYGSDAELEGDGEESEDSEEAESEDEDGAELTPAVDAAILRTLARIKRRDPSIYDAEKGVFAGVHHNLPQLS
jgi:hypothetical protein